eukprot:865922-Prorocentrum_lima.AAC.1
MQNMEIKTIAVHKILLKLREDVDENKRGLGYLSDQVDQLEQNLEVNVPTQSTPLPSPITPHPPTPLP